MTPAKKKSPSKYARVIEIDGHKRLRVDAQSRLDLLLSGIGPSTKSGRTSADGEDVGDVVPECAIGTSSPPPHDDWDDVGETAADIGGDEHSAAWQGTSTLNH